MRDQAPADVQAPIGASMSTFEAMYRGALIALDVSSLRMAPWLGRLTRTEGEAWAVIALMRKAPAGDRVRPAIEWLRARRHGSEVDAL